MSVEGYCFHLALLKARKGDSGLVFLAPWHCPPPASRPRVASAVFARTKYQHIPHPTNNNQHAQRTARYRVNSEPHEKCDMPANVLAPVNRPTQHGLDQALALGVSR